MSIETIVTKNICERFIDHINKSGLIIASQDDSGGIFSSGLKPASKEEIEKIVNVFVADSFNGNNG